MMIISDDYYHVHHKRQTMSLFLWQSIRMKLSECCWKIIPNFCNKYRQRSVIFIIYQLVNTINNNYIYIFIFIILFFRGKMFAFAIMKCGLCSGGNTPSVNRCDVDYN